MLSVYQYVFLNIGRFFLVILSNMINIVIIYLYTVIFMTFVFLWVKYAKVSFCNIQRQFISTPTSRTNVLILDLCCKLKYQHEDLICIQLCHTQNIIYI